MFLPVTRKYFLLVVCDRMNSFIGQEIRTYLEVKFMPKQRELLKKFQVRLKILWEPGSLATLEYPPLESSVSNSLFCKGGLGLVGGNAA